MAMTSSSRGRRAAALLMAGALALGIGALVAPTSGAVPAAKGKPPTSTKPTKPKPTKTKTTKTKKTKTTKTKKTKTTKTKTTKTKSTKTKSTKTTTTSSTPPPQQRNPYLGTEQYVNVDWSQQVDAIAAPISSMLHFALEDAADQPTAVWLRSVDSVNTLTHHLDAALAQSKAHGKPVVVTLVLDDRPALNCRGWHNHDGFVDDVAIYRSAFLAPVVDLLSRPAYSGLRYAVVLEPGSIAELLPSVSTGYAACDPAVLEQSTVPVLQASLDALSTVPSAAVYLDGVGAANAGWDSTVFKAASLYDAVVTGAKRGSAGVAGLAVNVDGYAPWKEPFLTAGMMVGGMPVRSAGFYDWTLSVDNETYVGLLRAELLRRNWPLTWGVLLDTSRDGWGGSARPTAASTSSVLATFVDGSRLDRRPSRMDWCNQTGAGMGERPRATPLSGVDAYVWVHNPGVSDGIAVPGASTTGLGVHLECDPTYVGELTGRKASGAMAGAPEVGVMFPAALAQLASNAYPALKGLGTPTSTAPTSTAPTSTAPTSTGPTRTSATTSTNPIEPSCSTRPPTTSTSTS